MSEDGTRAVVGAHTDLDMLGEQVAALREFVADPDQAHDSDRVYAFSIRWGTLISGRLERLAYYRAQRALPADVDRRYTALLAELCELLPVIDDLGLARPKVLGE